MIEIPKFDDIQKLSQECNCPISDNLTIFLKSNLYKHYRLIVGGILTALMNKEDFAQVRVDSESDLLRILPGGELVNKYSGPFYTRSLYRIVPFPKSEDIKVLIFNEDADVTFEISKDSEDRVIVKDNTTRTTTLYNQSGVLLKIGIDLGRTMSNPLRDGGHSTLIFDMVTKKAYVSYFSTEQRPSAKDLNIGKTNILTEEIDSIMCLSYEITFTIESENDYEIVYKITYGDIQHTRSHRIVSISKRIGFDPSLLQIYLLKDIKDRVEDFDNLYQHFINK